MYEDTKESESYDGARGHWMKERGWQMDYSHGASEYQVDEESLLVKALQWTVHSIVVVVVLLLLTGCTLIDFTNCILSLIKVWILSFCFDSAPSRITYPVHNVNNLFIILSAADTAPSTSAVNIITFPVSTSNVPLVPVIPRICDYIIHLPVALPSIYQWYHPLRKLGASRSLEL
jgi:hypothetical protein